MKIALVIIGVVVLLGVGFIAVNLLFAPEPSGTEPPSSQVPPPVDNGRKGDDIRVLSEELIVGSDSFSAASDDSGEANIFVMKIDGTDKRDLTSGGKNGLPAWSYDGKKIVYMHVQKQGENPQVWTMDSDGKNKKQLTFLPDGGISPAFSPDGTKIVYASMQNGRHPEIVVMNSDGTNKRQLTTTTGSSITRNNNKIMWNIHSSFSPDGKKIVYASTQSGKSQIWVMNADGTNQTQLTFPGNPTAPDANAPAWSPDGKKIAFWSGYETEYGNIWVINADGTGRTQLTHETEVNINSDNPNWSPDGKSIIFESNRNPNPYKDNSGAQTWIMNADGSNPRILFPFAYGAGRKPWKQISSTTNSSDSSSGTYIKQHTLLLINDFTQSSIHTIRGDGTGKTLLTSNGIAPSWTPDGKIIFSSDRSGSMQIWIMDADGSNARQISDLPASTIPMMAQIGKNGLIVFMGNAIDTEGNAGISIMHSDGSGLKELTRGTQPFLSLSGTWITYTVETANPYHREIWRINTDGTNKQQLTFLGDPDYPDANAPSISPDETMVAFFSGKEADRGHAGVTQSIFTWGYRNVAVMSATGGPRRTLTPCHPVTTQEQLDATSNVTGDCVAADNPAWSPDGKWLIFDIGFKSGSETWLIDLNGKNFQKFYPYVRGVVRVPLLIQGE